MLVAAAHRLIDDCVGVDLAHGSAAAARGKRYVDTRAAMARQAQPSTSPASRVEQLGDRWIAAVGVNV